MGRATALDNIGGKLPVDTEEFANRAYLYTKNPGRNPLKEMMDKYATVTETPPFLGIFNDVPRHQFRESEALAWARAGFSWIVNDGEHLQWEGTYGRDQNAAEARLGLLPVQRLGREAISGHGDSFPMGARATMRPYGTTYEEAEVYYRAVNFPEAGTATRHDRGGYPVRGGDRVMRFTPESLRAAETEVQGWLQFETPEYIMDVNLRDRVLDLMAAQGRNKACVFIGPFDAILRGGATDTMNKAINDLLEAGVKRGLYMGRVVGSGSMEDPKQIEEAMIEAIDHGCRLISVHPITTDLPYIGSTVIAEPFFRACERSGF